MAIQNVLTKTKPTMHDVARLANVSIATVSAAFNKGPVREQTRNRIFEAARKLGYRPNLIARSMITKRTHMLGMVLPWSNVEITDSAVIYANKNKYGLMSLFSAVDSENSEQKCIESLIERMVDGIIFCPEQGTSEDYAHLLSTIRSAGIKVVLIDRYFNEIKVDSVVTDNIKGGKLATEHLLKLGHKKILFLMYNPNASSTSERLEGYRLAMTEAGILFDSDMIAKVDVRENARNLAKEILSERKDITAVFATGDHLAYDVMLACKEIGRKIPDDISLVGFDDILLGPHRIGELLNPPLTTVRQDFSSMVSQAVELLISKIKNNTPDSGRIKYVQPELIVRESCKKVTVN